MSDANKIRTNVFLRPDQRQWLKDQGESMGTVVRHAIDFYRAASPDERMALAARVGEDMIMQAGGDPESEVFTDGTGRTPRERMVELFEWALVTSMTDEERNDPNAFVPHWADFRDNDGQPPYSPSPEPGT